MSVARRRIVERPETSLREALLPPTYKHINTKLVTDFFLVFSRFEYALKRAEFVFESKARHDNPDDSGRANPDWRRFSESIESFYDPHDSPQLAEAIDYLLSRPPQCQVVKQGGSLGWRPLEKRKNQTEVDWLLDTVKMVRNNLFHGGKHMEEPARDNKLLKSSLIVLEACLRWNPDVKKVYETYGA